MHIASWRSLPLVMVVAIAGLMLWALISIFGSESSSNRTPTPLVAAGAADDLPRIPLAFPDVAQPMVEALPSPEPSPTPSPEAAAARARRRTTTATTTTTPERSVPVTTDEDSGRDVVGERGDATFGSSDASDRGDDDNDRGEDDNDLVGDINDELGDIGPGGGNGDPEKDPEPSEDEEPEIDESEEDVENTGGKDGSSGASSTFADPGNSNEGDVE